MTTSAIASSFLTTDDHKSGVRPGPSLPGGLASGGQSAFAKMFFLGMPDSNNLLGNRQATDTPAAPIETRQRERRPDPVPERQPAAERPRDPTDETAIGSAHDDGPAAEGTVVDTAAPAPEDYSSAAEPGEPATTQGIAAALAGAVMTGQALPANAGDEAGLHTMRQRGATAAAPAASAAAGEASMAGSTARQAETVQTPFAAGLAGRTAQAGLRSGEGVVNGPGATSDGLLTGTAQTGRSMAITVDAEALHSRPSQTLIAQPQVQPQGLDMAGAPKTAVLAGTAVLADSTLAQTAGPRLAPGGAAAISGISGPTSAQGTNAGAATPTATRTAASAGPAVEQIAVRITKAASEGLDRISVQLRPAELGRVDVQMEVGRDGRVIAVISAERSETLDLLQRDARSLERALQEAGLKADTASQTYNQRGQGDHAQSQEHGRPLSSAAAGDATGDSGIAQTFGRTAAHHDGAYDLHV
ncbi:MAG: flagellar hook-length control protein FliK [Alphaproteobacteria bacterium]